MVVVKHVASLAPGGDSATAELVLTPPVLMKACGFLFF